MPLRAILDNQEVQSFNQTNEEWQNLKNSYRNHELTMHCCDRKAIPKTSKLGTHYFAHSKLGDCSSAPETVEHLHLKYLAAKAATECGWEVYTEYHGETKAGEKWIADVYCSKGKAAIALEMQWSQQTEEEFKRRQGRYAESGVRCAWLYRLHGRREYTRDDLSQSEDLPIFGFRKDLDTNSFIVSQFKLQVEEFIKALLTGQMSWSPKSGDELEVGLIPFIEPCWRCKKGTAAVIGLDIQDKLGNHLGLPTFLEPGTVEWITKYYSPIQLAVHGIGPIKKRYSKTINKEYISNGCTHCDALLGTNYIRQQIRQTFYAYDERLPIKPRITWLYNSAQIKLKTDWRLNGRKGEYLF